MPYDPRYYDPTDYATETMAVGALVSDRAATVWCLDLYLDSGWPVTYSRTFDAAPLRVSSLDLTPDGTALGSYLYEARLLEAPVVVSSALDEFGTQLQGETLRFRLAAKPPHGGVDLHAWVASEHRGKRVDGWLVDLDPTTLAATTATQVFSGEILTMADDPGSVDVLVRVFDVWSLTQAIPTTRVDASWAPYAPPAGMGQVVPHGTGIGRRIRCHPIKARSLDDTLVSLTATASAASDSLTVLTGYDWVTGDGPVRVRTTGTLPGGLATGTDYFVVAVNDVTIRLATTRGNALANTVIDLTSAGTGTLTVESGVAPNLDEYTDFVVGVGNVAVCQVWLDGETEVPEWPLDYQVLTQAYRADGRYLTVLRFPGDLSEATVEADVLRVDPDVDGSCLVDAKFTRGFQNDADGTTLVVDTFTTGDLTIGAHRFGLGALRGVTDATLALPVTVQHPTRTVHLLWTVPAAESDGTLYDDGAVQLLYDGVDRSLTLMANYGAATTWISSTASNSLTPNALITILIQVDAATGVVALLLDGTSVLSHTMAGAQRFGARTVVGPFAGTLHRVRVWARVLSAAEVMAAFWRWRRNGIRWLAELLETGGQQLDPTSLATALTAWDAIESGALVVDGWMSQETDVRAAVLALTQLRAVRLTTAGGRIGVALPSAAPSTVALLGHGDQRGNLLDVPQRVRASQTEAPRELVVRFRRERADDVTAYAREIRRTVFAAGGQPVTLDLPWIDDPVAADIVSDWVTKRLLARDQVVRTATGRDGRDLTLGGLVDLQVPAMGIAWEAECVALERGAQRHGVALVPWSAAPFVYTPQVLPPDPLSPLFSPVWLGTEAQIYATVEGSLVRVEVIPAEQLAQQSPIGDAVVTISDPLTAGIGTSITRMSGASEVSPLAYEVDDGTSDDDATAIRLSRSVSDATVATVAIGFVWPEVEATLPVFQVTLQIRARAGDVNEPIIAWAQGTTPDPRFSTTPTTLIGGVTSYVTETRSLVPENNVTWTGALVNASPFGFQCSGYAQDVYVTRMRRTVYYRLDVPQSVRVRFWRQGPGGSAPATPPTTAAPVVEVDGFAPAIDQPGGSGTWWYWAGVYDAVGRLVQVFGPVGATVA